MNIVTSGAKSGIGRYIHETLGGSAVTRETTNEEMTMLQREGADIIVHCAFNSQKQVTATSLYNYFNDNVLLTDRLISIPHKKFIYFSTVDIYPKEKNVNEEDDIIFLDDSIGIYAETKLISEAIIKAKCRDYLILRPTTLVGAYARKNTLMNIISGDEEELFLSGESQFNYVLHEDVLEFIRTAIDLNLTGTYNVASSENIKLSDVAAMMNCSVTYGSHTYKVGNISNNKIASVCPVFTRTSRDTLKHYIGEYAHA